MEWSPAIIVLDVQIKPSLDQEPEESSRIDLCSPGMTPDRAELPLLGTKWAAWLSKSQHLLDSFINQSNMPLDVLRTVMERAANEK